MVQAAARHVWHRNDAGLHFTSLLWQLWICVVGLGEFVPVFAGLFVFLECSMILQIDAVGDAVVKANVGLFAARCACLQFCILFEQQVWLVLVGFAGSRARGFGHRLCLMLFLIRQLLAAAVLHRFRCGHDSRLRHYLFGSSNGRWHHRHRVGNQCSCFFVHRVRIGRVGVVIRCFSRTAFGTRWALCCGWCRRLFGYCSKCRKNNGFFWLGIEILWEISKKILAKGN